VVTEIAEIDSTPEEIRIYPNPATDQITFSSEKPFSKIEIYSVTGTLISQLKVSNENQVKITTDNYNAGIYFVHIFQEKERITKKFMVK
jgi:hypothetical protein